mmetsp:Transcript_20697/g.33451  ORF Transcript_20697/g.33451 Transcript_20697/m.33451 type:complete len:649 (+) Transcript_20697:52-1998(+)
MSQPVTIVCLGDSLTGGAFTRGYPAMLQDMLRQQQPGRQWNVKSYGAYGARTLDWLNEHIMSSQYKQAIAGGCDAIVLMLGTNDASLMYQAKTYMATGVAEPSSAVERGTFDEQQFRQRLTQVAQRVMRDAPGAALFLAIPPPLEQSHMADASFDRPIIHTIFPRLIPQIAASLGATCIDCFSALGGNNAGAGRPKFGDHVHMHDEGDRLIAQAVCQHVMGVSSRGSGANNAMQQASQLHMSAQPQIGAFGGISQTSMQSQMGALGGSSQVSLQSQLGIFGGSPMMGMLGGSTHVPAFVPGLVPAQPQMGGALQVPADALGSYARVPAVPQVSTVPAFANQALLSPRYPAPALASTQAVPTAATSTPEPKMTPAAKLNAMRQQGYAPTAQQQETTTTEAPTTSTTTTMQASIAIGDRVLICRPGGSSDGGVGRIRSIDYGAQTCQIDGETGVINRDFKFPFQQVQKIDEAINVYAAQLAELQAQLAQAQAINGFDVGDRVEGKFRDVWYKGVVKQRPQGEFGNYMVQCDEDPVGTLTPCAEVRLIEEMQVMMPEAPKVSEFTVPAMAPPAEVAKAVQAGIFDAGDVVESVEDVTSDGSTKWNMARGTRGLVTEIDDAGHAWLDVQDVPKLLAFNRSKWQSLQKVEGFV